MDERLKKRIYAFYFAGAVNLVLGCWVLLFGGELNPGARTIMLFFFFGFAAVDFWFPVLLKKKYEEQLAQYQQMQSEQAPQSEEPKQHS